MKKQLVIATRGSMLALWQAEYIKSKIEEAHPHVSCSLNIIKTTGDKILDVPLAKIGGKGLFVKEIEVALMNKEADLAVHSMKDVPMELPDGLELFACPKGAESNDAFVSFKYESAESLPHGAKVGTSSLRRKLQLLEKRPDLEILDLRGNLQTRLKKLEDGVYDAIILAEAGLRRLNLGHYIKQVLPVDFMLPASCQGILGVETRSDDTEVTDYLLFLKHPETETRAQCERAFLRKLQGGCQVPIACHSIFVDDDTLSVSGILYNLDGSVKIEKQMTGSAKEPVKLGCALADEVIKAGGDKILKEIYS